MPEVCTAQGSAECRGAVCDGDGGGFSAPGGLGDSRGATPRDDAPQPVASAALQPVWQAAGELHQLKLAFVAGIQRFTRAQTGTFGDEGTELIAALAAMKAALAQWDAAAAQFEAATKGMPPSAELHVVRAAMLLDRHKPADALRELTSAARLDSRLPDIPVLQSLAAGAAGRTDEALRAARQALQRDPTNPVLAYTVAQRAAEAGQADDAQRMRARVAQLLTSVASSADRAPFERVGLLRQAGGVAPIFPLAVYEQGYAALVTGEFAAGLELLERAVATDALTQANSQGNAVARAAALLRAGQTAGAREALQGAPESSEGHRLLALAHWADDDVAAAAEHARTAVRLDAANERARLLLADVLRAAGWRDQAQQALDDAVRALPGSGGAHFRLGQVHEAEGRADQARAAYLEAVRHAPVVGQDHLFFTLGNLAAKQADFDTAVEAYTRRIEVNPNSAEAHRQLGEIYFLQGRDDDALAEHSVAAYLSPGNGRAHAGRGQALLRLKRYQEAATALARAEEAGAGSPEARYALGQALLRAGRTNEGVAHITASNRLRADEAERGRRDFQVLALRRNAAQAMKDGRHAEAVTQLDEAVTLSPDDVDLRRDLGLALLAAGRASDALVRLAPTQRDHPTVEGADALARAYDAVGQTAGRDAARAQHARLLEQARRAKLAALAGGLALPESR